MSDLVGNPKDRVATHLFLIDFICIGSLSHALPCCLWIFDVNQTTLRKHPIKLIHHYFLFYREKEKNDLKSRLSELEDFKTKYEAERRENEVKSDKIHSWALP